MFLLLLNKITSVVLDFIGIGNFLKLYCYIYICFLTGVTVISAKPEIEETDVVNTMV